MALINHIKLFIFCKSFLPFPSHVAKSSYKIQAKENREKEKALINQGFLCFY